MNEDSGPAKESHNSVAMGTCCKCKKSESDVRGTQSAATSAVPSLQDAATSTCALEQLQQIQESRDEPKMKPPHFTTFHNLDELMNIMFCETEETEKLFINQAKEMLRRDFVLMEQKEKMNELNVLTQSTAAALEKCEGNLLYIDYAQRLMEHCLSSLLELYLRDTSTLPDDERGSFYNKILTADFLRMETKLALEDLTEISADQNEVNDNIIKLQILEILNYHYQVLSTALLKIEKIQQTIEELQESYKYFFEKYPYALICIPDKLLGNLGNTAV